MYLPLLCSWLVIPLTIHDQEKGITVSLTLDIGVPKETMLVIIERIYCLGTVDRCMRAVVSAHIGSNRCLECNILITLRINRL